MPDFDLTLLIHLLDQFEPPDRTALLPALHAAQGDYAHIPPAAARLIARKLGVPLYDCTARVGQRAS